MKFFHFALMNLGVQLLLFFFLASIPACRFKRMSYVDIAWPFGLMGIGILSLIFSREYTTRVCIVSCIYLAMGARMGLGALLLWKKGAFEKEFPRYLYQQIRWEKEGITNYDSAMQKEIYLQAAANSSFLVLPVLIQGANKNPTLSWLEVLGYGLWFAFFFLESLADFQKRKFQSNKENRKKVCNVGLWKFSRHPNYFSEWMVWNSIIISSLSSIYYLLGEENKFLIFVYLTALIFISKIMYECLVYYTGAKPSEYYSLQKRPDYKDYTERTNMFFPWFRRVF